MTGGGDCVTVGGVQHCGRETMSYEDFENMITASPPVSPDDMLHEITLLFPQRVESVVITDNFVSADGSRGQAVHLLRKANGPGCDGFDPTDPNRGHMGGSVRSVWNPTA